jgi:hypothetical protein
LTEHTIIPYKQPAASIRENGDFNELLAKQRVKIEHVNGILKGRFSSLNGIRTHIHNEKDLEFVLDWIVAILALHNITVEVGDDWRE